MTWIITISKDVKYQQDCVSTLIWSIKLTSRSGIKATFVVVFVLPLIRCKVLVEKMQDMWALIFLFTFLGNQAFKKGRSMGLGDLDFSAVHETIASGKGSSWLYICVVPETRFLSSLEYMMILPRRNIVAAIMLQLQLCAWYFSCFHTILM